MAAILNAPRRKLCGRLWGGECKMVDALLISAQGKSQVRESLRAGKWRDYDDDEADSVGSGIAGVSPALLGVPPNRSIAQTIASFGSGSTRDEAIDETP